MTSFSKSVGNFLSESTMVMLNVRSHIPRRETWKIAKNLVKNKKKKKKFIDDLLDYCKSFVEPHYTKYGVFSGSYFPVFALNTGKYGPEKTSCLGTFHAVSVNSSDSGKCNFMFFSLFLKSFKLHIFSIPPIWFCKN